MSTLHDELEQLTAAQPGQPVDRLQAVTGKARRIRRNRAVASCLAVLLVGGGVAGSLLRTSTPRTHGYAATPVTAWPDRSTPEGIRLGFGGFSSWYGAEDGADVGLRWLYRDVVAMPDGTSQVVADFIATKDYVTYLVTTHAPKVELDSNGASLSTDGSAWQVDALDLATVRTPPRHVDHLFSYDKGTELLSIQAPSARSLGVHQQPLPYAAEAGLELSWTSLTLTSGDGVFTRALGGLAGPLTLTPPDHRGYPVTGEGGELPAAPPAVEHFPGAFVEGGGGGTNRSEDGTWPGGGSANLDPATVTLSITARCYGGGRLTATVSTTDAAQTKTRPVKSGSAACDGKVRTLLSGARVVRSPYSVELMGDRLQAFSYVVSRS